MCAPGETFVRVFIPSIGGRSMISGPPSTWKCTWFTPKPVRLAGHSVGDRYGVPLQAYLAVWPRRCRGGFAIVTALGLDVAKCQSRPRRAIGGSARRRGTCFRLPGRRFDKSDEFLLVLRHPHPAGLYSRKSMTPDTTRSATADATSVIRPDTALRSGGSTIDTVGGTVSSVVSTGAFMSATISMAGRAIL